MILIKVETKNGKIYTMDRLNFKIYIECNIKTTVVNGVCTVEIPKTPNQGFRVSIVMDQYIF